MEKSTTDFDKTAVFTQWRQNSFIFYPSLNTQSCNRRPLFSTFTFENVRGPKRTVLFQKKFRKFKEKIQFIMQLFSAEVRKLEPRKLEKNALKCCS